MPRAALSREIYEVIREAFFGGVTRSTSTGGGGSRSTELLGEAIEKLERKQYREAADLVKEAASVSECGICRRKLIALGADIIHAATVCEIDSEECGELEERLKKKMKFYKEDFIPNAERLKRAEDAL